MKEPQLDSLDRLIDQAVILGASYASIMHHEIESSIITAENGVMKSYVNGKIAGLGIRVIVDGTLGIASSTNLDFPTLRTQVEYAVKMAQATKTQRKVINLSTEKVIKTTSKSQLISDPSSVSDQEKIEIAINANKSAMLDGVKSSITRLAWLHERRIFKSSEGSDVTSDMTMTGLSQSSIASFEGEMESFSDSKSRCAGFEYISRIDWCEFSKEVSETALRVVRARTPKAGYYHVVADPDLVGLILHEAFGHATEADLVTVKESVLDNCLGKSVASPLVTILDEGVHEGGYFFPYDDEGSAKTKQIIVDKGILMGFLHSRETAHEMNTGSTGNARTQSFSDKPIVRQTNFFMEAGEQEVEELIEEIEDGLYLCGRGARGGEVDVGLGTFTFRAGPSYMIRKGEVSDMVRGVSISGMILDTLKHLDAVGKELKVKTSIFGGCGKDGQMVRVGHGGPYVRIRGVMVGGGI